MNYLYEINQFYCWLETHPLSGAAICLWHALMNVSNKARWPEEIVVALAVLTGKTGYSLSMIERARKELEQAGRIRVIPQGANRAARYHIMMFGDGQLDAHSAAHLDGRTQAQYARHSDQIRKQKTKTKQDFFHRDEKKESQELEQWEIDWLNEKARNIERRKRMQEQNL